MTGSTLIDKLDEAWERINALGSPDTAQSPDDLLAKGVNQTVDRALSIIEALGGMDPLSRDNTAKLTAGAILDGVIEAHEEAVEARKRVSAVVNNSHPDRKPYRALIEEWESAESTFLQTLRAAVAQAVADEREACCERIDLMRQAALEAANPWNKLEVDIRDGMINSLNALEAAIRARSDGKPDDGR